jgi:hypothetical protein
LPEDEPTMAKMRRLRSAASSIAPGAIAIESDMRFPRDCCGAFKFELPS